MSDPDDQTTVGASDDLLAEVQAWVAHEKAPSAAPPAGPWQPPVAQAPEALPAGARPPTEAPALRREQRPPPSAENVWRAPDDSNWRPPGRLAGAADAPVPGPVHTRRTAVGLMAAIGLVGALLGGALVWAVASRDSGPTRTVDDPPADIPQADDDSQLGG
ncbi:MAG: hypothetical protein GY929_10620 [Actinomycetia bacterium]|nr:hypothetical protein [Actinomycetes bacterium]